MNSHGTPEETVVRKCPQEGCAWSTSGPRRGGVLDRVKELVRHLASEHKSESEYREVPELHHKAAYVLAEMDSDQWGVDVPTKNHPFWDIYYRQAEAVLHLIRKEEPGVTVQVWPTSRVLREVSCGSGDWSWEEEWKDLDERHAESGYLDHLESDIKSNGIRERILIGSDGRLWDGHHRLRIAVRLGIEYVPVELA